MSMPGRTLRVGQRRLVAGWPARRSGGAHEGQGGHVVVDKGRTAELTDGIQHGCANLLGAHGTGCAQAFFYALQAEFEVFFLLVLALSFDDASRNQQKGGAFLDTYRRSIAGGMGKKPKRQAGSRQFGNPGVVAKKPGAMSGVGVAEGAEALVVAADKGWAGTHTAGHVHDAAVEPQAEFGHGLGFVDIQLAEQIASQLAKDFLRGGENGLVVLAASGDVEQPK